MPVHTGNGMSDLLGKDVICETISGDRLVKVLAAGTAAGLFDLRSYDPRKPDIRNAQLAWAAPVRLIVRDKP